MMFRAARKLTGMARMIPNRVAIMPMKMVSTIRWSTICKGSLTRGADRPTGCRATTRCG